MNNNTANQALQIAYNQPEYRHEIKFIIQGGKLISIVVKRILLTKN